MKQGWEIKRLDDACEVEYGTRVVQKKDGGTVYPVYGGGGATFFMDTFNREDCLVVARFAMSAQCTRFVEGKFFLNDSGLTVRPKNDKELLPDFLNLQMFFLNDHIYSLARGTAQRNLDVPAFRNIQIAYPKSIQEQQSIVSILNEYFSTIAKAKTNAEQNLKNAKELFKSCLQTAFENKVHGERFESLDNLCELIVDCEHKTAPTQETGYPSIRTPNIGKGELILENVNRVSYETYLQWTRRAVPKSGDLILAREAPAGNIAVIPENIEVCLGQRTVLLRPKKNRLVSKYLAYLILSKEVQEILLSHSTGATVQHINMKDIRAFKIYDLSDLKEQIAVVQKLDSLRAETQKLEAVYQKKLDDLEELKKSILQKAFAGELKTEKVLEYVSR